MAEHIVGKITRLFCPPKPDNWFAGLIRTQEGDTIKLSGIANVPVRLNMTVECDADFQYTDYGEQYSPVKGSMITRVLTGRSNIVEFLSSSLFPGIGKITAEKIYASFGDDSILKLQENPDDVAAQCGLRPSQIKTLTIGVNATVGTAALVKAYPHMRVKTADKILEENEGLTVNTIQLDVSSYGAYTTFCSLGVGTYETDEIAIEDCNADEFGNRRLDMIMRSAIRKFCDDRRATYINMSDAFEWQRFYSYYFMRVKLYRSLWQAIDESGISFDANTLMSWVQANANDDLHHFEINVIETDNGKIVALYDRAMKSAEDTIVDEIGSNSGGLPETHYKWIESAFNEVLAHIPNVKSMYTQEQIKAVCNAVKYGVTFITGGPGTGKTKTLALLINVWQRMYGDNILMLAPTGRAVNRMKAQTGYEKGETVARFVAMNEHRKHSTGMMYSVGGDKIARKDSVLVIVDESSMLDYITVSKLLDFGHGCTFVFVGDEDQLSPIEPGMFFAECLKCKAAHVTRLTQNFRAESPEIIENANIMMRNEKPLGFADFKLTPNFQILPCLERPIKDEPLSQSEQFILNAYRSYMAQGADFNDIMIITPFAGKKYRLSAANLNEVLQNEVNPEVSVAQASNIYRYDDFGRYLDVRGLSTGLFDNLGVQIRIGDRIMNTKNNMTMEYKSYKNDNAGVCADEIENPDADNFGVLNGDMGTVVRMYPPSGDRSDFAVLIELDDTRSDAEKALVYQPKKYVFVHAKLEGKKKKSNKFETWRLGYATSIHKAQGCEAKHVIIALSGEGYCATRYMIQNGIMPFLTKNMLYTAVTRAKETVSIIGSKDAFIASVNTPFVYTNANLTTGLANEIAEAMSDDLSF